MRRSASPRPPHPSPDRAARPRRTARAVAGLLAAVSSVVAVGAVPVVTATTATAATAATATVKVDFAATTGAFRGGASGTLYGLGDADVPSKAVLDGARVTNTSQKPPNGAQHPNGDALQVEKDFFAAGGKDLYVYMQDAYPDFAYNGGKRPGDANGDGEWDYLPIVRKIAEDVATGSTNPSGYLFVPFNEPDGINWYPDWSTQKDQFLADWSAVHDAIEQVYAENGLGRAKIAGPGDFTWEPVRSRDILSYTKARNELPDVFIWHELGIDNLGTYRGHKAEYDALLSDLGLPAIPVNISEWGLLRDMGVPGQLVQWMSMFEDSKVDAQSAFWNYAGNLSDNSSRTNGANGGWWMFKWYGDLAGSQTATVTPPQPNTPDTLQALAAVDTAARKATVLVGGGSDDIALSMTGLPTTLRGQVDVTVRADRLNGAEGDSLQPPVVLSTRATVQGDSLALTIPNSDPHTAYQVLVTPPQANRAAVDPTLVSSVEAEDTTLANATVYQQDTSRSFSFFASRDADVGSFNKPGSSATWTVDAPRKGDYRLTVLGGTNGAPGQHALFVDGAYAATVRYGADLNYGYRGTTDTTLALGAGTHTLSLRASRDGSTLLPGADLTLDRFDLREVTSGLVDAVPATQMRLAGGAALSWSSSRTAGGAALSGSATATAFVTTAETGYHDVSTSFTTAGASALQVAVGGRALPTATAARAGSYTATTRVWLSQGVNELTVSSPKGAVLDSLQAVRGPAARAADASTAAVDRVQAETLARTGAAAVRTIPASVGSNGSADADGAVGVLGFVGRGAANTATLARPAGFGAGEYVLTVSASNGDKVANLNYNPQVITRFMDVREQGGASTQLSMRHNFSFDSFWDKSIPLTLTTPGGPITFGNDTTYAPDLDVVTLARLVTGTTTVSPVLAGPPPVAVPPVGRADVAVTLRSASTFTAKVSTPVTVTVTNKGPQSSEARTTTLLLVGALDVVDRGTGTVRGSAVTFATPVLAPGASVSHTVQVRARTASGGAALLASQRPLPSDPVLLNNGAVKLVRFR